MKPEPKRLAYSVRGAAEAIGVSTSKIRALIRGGFIASTQLPRGRKRLIPASELDRLLRVDLAKERGDQFRDPENAGRIPLRRPTDQTSRTRGLVRPQVEVESKPMPQDAEDTLHLRHAQPGDLPPGVTEARPRDTKGRYILRSEKKNRPRKSESASESV